jgi:predicted RNase H-like HicB family nuclease
VVGDEVTQMTFLITLQRDEDGVYVAECPAIPGCVSQGRTEHEATTNVEAAIRECLAVRAELGMPLLVETRTVDVAV